QLESAGHPLPVFFGNRNWHPMVEDTVAEMRDKGIRRAAVFTTSAWGGYSGCKQYVEDIARARAAVGDGAPELVKLRQYFDHPSLVQLYAEA
ncbi:ferrochelatase, partial [Mycobacterium tuberculosis]